MSFNNKPIFMTNQGIAEFEAALLSISNKTLPVPGSNGVLRVERSLTEKALSFEWFDGNRIWRSVCTLAEFELHKAKSRLDLAWKTLFQLMNDALESDPPGVALELNRTESANIDLWFIYMVNHDVTVRAAFELQPTSLVGGQIAKRALEILLAQIRESAAVQKKLFDKIASIEAHKGSIAAANITTPIPILEPSTPRARQRKRPRKAFQPHALTKGIRLKDGF